jgi:hypothetical protein
MPLEFYRRTFERPSPPPYSGAPRLLPLLIGFGLIAGLLAGFFGNWRRLFDRAMGEHGRITHGTLALTTGFATLGAGRPDLGCDGRGIARNRE